MISKLRFRMRLSDILSQSLVLFKLLPQFFFRGHFGLLLEYFAY